MPAGVTASNIRNNRKKQQQQSVGFVAINDNLTSNENNSPYGSDALIGFGPGGGRRVGWAYTIVENIFYYISLIIFARCVQYMLWKTFHKELYFNEIFQKIKFWIFDKYYSSNPVTGNITICKYSTYVKK